MRARLERSLAELEERFGGPLAVCCRDEEGAPIVAYRADTPMITASTIKALVLARTLQADRDGDVTMNQRVRVGREHHVPGSGILCDVRDGAELTIADLCRLMIVVSDNVATNVLLELIGGPAAVTALAADLGLDSVSMSCGVDHARLAEEPRLFGEATPADLSLFMHLASTGRVVDAAASATILQMMARQQYLDQFPRYLDCSRYTDATGIPATVHVTSKTGEWPGARADVGRLDWDSAWLTYAAMCDGSRDLSIGPDSEPAVVVGLVGALVMRELAPTTVKLPAEPGTAPGPQWLEDLR